MPDARREPRICRVKSVGVAAASDGQLPIETLAEDAAIAAELVLNLGSGMKRVK
jgi:hypothetical protein